MIGQSGILNEINVLVRYYFDGKEDYRLAGSRAPDKDQKEALNHECQVRERMHKELQEIETSMNVEMSDNGHVSSDYKRDWERLRGSIAGNGLEASLKLAHAADTHAIEQAERLVAAGLPEPLQSTIVKHLGELRQAVSRLDTWTAEEHKATA